MTAEEREVNTDQAGHLSSKRIWAGRFGWATIMQIVFMYALSTTTVIIGKAVQESIIDVLQYGIMVTAALCGLLLGVTLAEWFSPRARGNNER